MKIDDAQKLLKELFGVEVNIIKEVLFKGYDVALAYPFYINEEKHYKFVHYHEQDPDDWEVWAEEHKDDITKKLSIL